MWEIHTLSEIASDVAQFLGVPSNVDVVEPPKANRQNVGLHYPRRTAANFDGGSWYLRSVCVW